MSNTPTPALWIRYSVRLTPEVRQEVVKEFECRHEAWEFYLRLKKSRSTLVLGVCNYIENMSIL